jgi:hypothetical protein
MKITSIIIGMAASLILPLAGATARAVSDPGLHSSGAGVVLDSGVAATDVNFGRRGGGRGSHKGSKSPSKPH